MDNINRSGYHQSIWLGGLVTLGFSESMKRERLMKILSILPDKFDYKVTTVRKKEMSAILAMFILIALLIPAVSAAGENWLPGYNYRMQITFTSDTAKIPSTQTDFPVLVNLTEPDLKTVANGGHVQNANGYDISFTSSDGSTVLSHEIERYNTATGEYIAWVKIPGLSTNVIIYIYYGNSTATTNPSTPAVWDANYTMVQHQDETSGTLTDSTSNANNGTPYFTPVTNQNATGKIEGADSFDGVNDYVDLCNNLGYTTQVSAFAWFKSQGAPAGNYHIIFGGQELEISIYTTGYLRTGVYTNQRYVSNHGSGLTDGNWHYVGFIFNGSTKKSYIDGAFVGEQTAIAGSLTYSFANRRMGRWGASSVYYANGAIDEVRISNSARSADWIKTEYSNQNDPCTFYSVGTEEISAPVADFTAIPVTGFAPLNVQFNDTTANSPTMWNWSFGDTSWFNTTDSSLSNATKCYLSGGNYTVTLFVSNSGGSDNVSHYVDVWNRTSNDFAANVTSGNVTFPVQFTDTSYNATSWYWMFDGMNTSTSQNPVFEYTVPGIYSVNHSSGNAHDTFWTNKTNYITAYDPFVPGATANFSQNSTQGLTPLSVLLTDTSTGTPTFWNWSFGDGTYSDSQNVTKTYPTGGYYEINLTVWNTNTTSSSKLGYLDVWNRTSNDFIANQTSGNVTFPVLFTDTSYNATSWFWIFDGMNTSTSQNPVFEYAVPGVYSVNHSSGNAHDTFWTNKSSYIVAYLPVASAPVASFTGIPTSGTAPLTVQFTDLSTGSPTGWNWSFGDGNYSTLQSPAHTYASAGTFSVSLNASNSAGNNLSTWSNYIDVTSSIIPPTASFTGTPTTGAVPLTVQFTDTSNGSPTSWNWSFGDGSYSTSRNPSHTYSATGTYTVSLNATNSAGSNTATRANYITVSATPVITPTPLSGDSDSTCFVPSTSGATEAGARAGERITAPFTGNLEADDSIPVVVVAISIVPSIDIQGVLVSAIKAPVGLTTMIPGNPPAYFLDINIKWVREDAVKEGAISFSVDDGWLKEQGITPADLVMTRYHDNTWSELPTRMENYSNGRYYYVAKTSGFSYFAVTRKGAGATKTTPTPTPIISITQQIKSESTTSATTRPFTQIPVRTKPVTATTTVPPASRAESPEFPINWIVFGVAGFTGFILSIAFIRRWWIRRQNPALFRKYD